MQLLPRYNMAPLDVVPAIFDEEPKSLSVAQWGIPTDSGSEEKSNIASQIAKEELEKFDWALNRCVLPADGYYEWPEDDAHAFPELISVQGESVFMLAGVWTWLPAGADGAFNLRACALVVTQTNGLVAATHSNMPAILREEHVATWLSAETPSAALAEILAPYPAEAMRRRQVDCRLNRA